MANLSIKDTQEINRLRALFPSEIRVHVGRSEDDGFFAEILTFPGCFTEANTLSELIEMVNDSVKTYFEVPEEYFPYMANYLPLIQLAQSLDVFPVTQKQYDIELKLTSATK